jgi:tellurite methyltransferase
VCADAARDLPGGPFDLVYSCGSIHYIPREGRPDLFSRLKAATRPGGHHAHVVFTDRLVHVEMREQIDYFTSGELPAAYADWVVLACDSSLIGCAQDGTRHRHSVDRLVARQPHATGP